MDIRSELINLFKIFGADLSGKILDKCEELCNTYDVSPEELGDQWSAYSAVHLHDGVPTLQDLAAMERKEFIRHQNKNVSTSKKTISTPTTMRVYKEELQDLDPETAILSSYTTPKSVKSNAKRIRSPDEDTSKKRFQPGNLSFSPSLTSSPSSYSPVTGSQSSDYADRTDSGNAMLSYGLTNLLKKATFKCNLSDKENMVSIGCWSEEDRLPSDARYMYEVMNTKAASLNDMIERLGKSLIEKYKLDDPQPYTKVSGVVTTYGRICCDADGKLNAASVLLEGSRELTRGSTIQLNLSKLPSYAIFPGQVVAVQGYNPSGNSFVAEKLYTDASLSPQPTEHRLKFTEPLQIVVAAGPFTLRDNLTYQPLQDLIKYVSNNVPHVLILVGPFIDVSHENISDATMAESYDTFFETLVGCVMTPLEGLNVQVVLIASPNDAHHHIVFPTPPYTIRKKYANLHCVADPNLLNIEGLVLGATSADILLHLGKEEVCSSQGGDRMSRLASHLLGQQSFYPLYPSDESISIDHELLEHHASMDVIPHILVVPSNLRYFIKYIQGCVVINPERLAKGYVGGTFARIEVVPPNEAGFPNNIVAQIIRI